MNEQVHSVVTKPSRDGIERAKAAGRNDRLLLRQGRIEGWLAACEAFILYLHLDYEFSMTPEEQNLMHALDAKVKLLRDQGPPDDVV